MFQGPSAGFSTVGYKTETRREEEKEEGVEETSEVHGDDGLQQSSELIITNSLLKNTAHSSCHSRYLWTYFQSSSNIPLFIVFLLYNATCGLLMLISLYHLIIVNNEYL